MHRLACCVGCLWLTRWARASACLLCWLIVADKVGAGIGLLGCVGSMVVLVCDMLCTMLGRGQQRHHVASVLMSCCLPVQVKEAAPVPDDDPYHLLLKHPELISQSAHRQAAAGLHIARLLMGVVLAHQVRWGVRKAHALALETCFNIVPQGCLSLTTARAQASAPLYDLDCCTILPSNIPTY